MLVIAVVLFFWGGHYAGMAYEEYAIMTETKKQNEYLRNEVILKNEKNPMERKVDFALLEEINPDIVDGYGFRGHQSIIQFLWEMKMMNI